MQDARNWWDINIGCYEICLYALQRKIVIISKRVLLKSKHNSKQIQVIFKLKKKMSIKIVELSTEIKANKMF